MRAEVYAHLGIVYTELGHLDLAVYACLRAGQSYEVQQKFDDAISAYNRRTTPTRREVAEIYVHIVEMHIGQQGFDAAIQAYQAAKSNIPNLADIDNRLGHAYIKAGLLENAVDAFKQFLEIRPGSVEVRYRLGDAYGQFGYLPEAVGLTVTF